MKKQISQISNFFKTYSQEKIEEYLWDMFTYAFFEREKQHLQQKHGTDLTFKYKLIEKTIMLMHSQCSDELVDIYKHKWLNDAYTKEVAIEFLDEMFFSFISSKTYQAHFDNYRAGSVRFYQDLKQLLTIADSVITELYLETA